VVGGAAVSGAGTVAFGEWRIEKHELLDSTNTRALTVARELLAAGKSPERRAFVAERQSAGRGQHGRVWESPPGGLYLSAMVTDVEVAYRDRLALLAGAAALAALHGAGARMAAIWWPNDLMLGDRKVGGILCESAALGSAWAGVIGIGINITTPVSRLPARAAALAQVLGHAAPVQDIAQAFLRELNLTLSTLRDRGWPAVLDFLRAHDSLRGQIVTLKADGEQFTGTAAGLDEEGNLLVTIAGQMRRFAAATLLTVGGHPLRAATP
jgi:BirA family biotin operon repressor/biotin-[acetyl-CoA-carboxylase] ligase